jgi:hypothetical protein
VNDDILAQQHFLRARKAERRELETGLIVEERIATSYWGKERSAENWALETLLKRASKPNQKDHCSLLTPACAPSSYVMSLLPTSSYPFPTLSPPSSSLQITAQQTKLRA